MAKKAYTVEDELGHIWLVRIGDPAYPIVAVLKYPLPVLPFETLRTGVVEEARYGKVAKSVARLSRYCSEVEDPDSASLLVRLVGLMMTLDEYRATLKPQPLPPHPSQAQEEAIIGDEN